MAESTDTLAAKLRQIATEETFLNAYRRRRAGDHYDRELIAFDVGGECYAVGITELHEIIKMRPITEVPRVPAFVKGIVTVRGQVIPAIDLRMRLGMPEVARTRASRIIVCDVLGEPHGLIVDRVRSVVRLRDDQIESSPQLGGGGEVNFIAGVGRDEDDLIILLDLAAVVSFSLDEGG